MGRLGRFFCIVLLVLAVDSFFPDLYRHVSHGFLEWYRKWQSGMAVSGKTLKKLVDYCGAGRRSDGNGLCLAIDNSGARLCVPTLIWAGPERSWLTLIKLNQRTGSIMQGDYYNSDAQSTRRKTREGGSANPYLLHRDHHFE